MNRQYITDILRVYEVYAAIALGGPHSKPTGDAPINVTRRIKWCRVKLSGACVTWHFNMMLQIAIIEAFLLLFRLTYLVVVL